MPKQVKVTLYSTSRCPHCRRVHELLKKHHVNFLEQNVERNRRAYKEFIKLGGRSVPLLSIGNQVIMGFDSKKIEAALQQLNLTR